MTTCLDENEGVTLAIDHNWKDNNAMVARLQTLNEMIQANDSVKNVLESCETAQFSTEEELLQM